MKADYIKTIGLKAQAWLIGATLVSHLCMAPNIQSAC